MLHSFRCLNLGILHQINEITVSALIFVGNPLPFTHFLVCRVRAPKLHLPTPEILDRLTNFFKRIKDLKRF